MRSLNRNLAANVSRHRLLLRVFVAHRLLKGYAWCKGTAQTDHTGIWECLRLAQEPNRLVSSWAMPYTVSQCGVVLPSMRTPGVAGMACHGQHGAGSACVHKWRFSAAALDLFEVLPPLCCSEHMAVILLLTCRALSWGCLACSRSRGSAPLSAHGYAGPVIHSIDVPVRRQTPVPVQS